MSDAGYAILPTRGVLAIGGEEARDFLQGLISNDVERVTEKTAIYASLLTPQGKFLHDFVLSAVDGQLLIDCEGARREDLQRRLTLYRLRRPVTIKDETDQWNIVTVFGPGCLGALDLPNQPGVAKPLDGGVAMVDPRLGDLGARLILPAESSASTLDALGLTKRSEQDYDVLRMRLGVPDGSRDIEVDRSFLLESNFEELNGVDFEKGCYVGQENTARQKHRGTIRKRLMPVSIDGPAPAPGTPILAGDKPAGTMRSSHGQQGIALIRLEHLPDDGAPALLNAGEASLAASKPDWANWAQESDASD